MTALTCSEFVEHISTCGGCEGFLDQFRQTIHLLGAP